MIALDGVELSDELRAEVVRELVTHAAVERRPSSGAHERAVSRFGRRVEQPVVEREREERAHHRLHLVIVDTRSERPRVERAAARIASVKDAFPSQNARPREASAGVLGVVLEAVLEPLGPRDARRALELGRVREDSLDRDHVDVDAMVAARILAECTHQAVREILELEDGDVDPRQRGGSVT